MIIWTIGVLDFHHCDKIPEKINLKEERLILTDNIRGFSTWSLGSVVSEL
jgi:hypothetical protein